LTGRFFQRLWKIFEKSAEKRVIIQGFADHSGVKKQVTQGWGCWVH